MDDIPICPEWWPQMLWKIHFPRPRPGPGPGPINYPPAIDHMMAALTIHSLSYLFLDKALAQDVRTLAETTLADTAKNLSKLHATGVPSGRRKELKLPSDEEIDAMAQFPSASAECDVLCQDYLDTLEALEDATGRRRLLLLARLRQLRNRMRELHCPPCLPQ
jgi:hypothetical protein